VPASEFGQTPAEIGDSSPGPAFDRFLPIDPLQFSWWDTLLSTHDGSSFFHGSAWTRVLHETYGHKPYYFCHIANSRIEALLPTMEVNSPWTGRRGVSLPFTDVCPILHPSFGDRGVLYRSAVNFGRGRGWRFLECRSTGCEWSEAQPSLAFYGHVLDLEPGPDALLKGLAGAVRRGIRKAEAAGLRIEFGAGLQQMRGFYSLHCRTRRRHGVPPQPIEFFENIVQHVFAAGLGFVATAYLENRPVAAAVFFKQRRQAHYNLGASD
jgi:hypothetical protein